jgi:glutathione S-transferase
MELFTDPQLPCPQRVHIMIKELGLDLKTPEIKIESQDHKVRTAFQYLFLHNLIRYYMLTLIIQDEAYLRLNPWGAVPCLSDSTLDPPLVLYE